VANRKKGRRARSRKRRAAGADPQASAQEHAPAPALASTQTASQQRRPQRTRRRAANAPAARSGSSYRDPGSVGERPHAPWHPFPLDELLILIGMVAVAVGAARGEAGKTLLFVGVAVVVIGTIDVTAREHLSGYRSHAGLLASIPTALCHGALALVLYALGAPEVTWVLVPLAIDVPLFSVLVKLLRGRFKDARRERVFAGRR
jgi:hypothetical protein